MVADVTREDSIDHLQDHIKMFFSINSKGFIIIALNKSDLLSEEKEKKMMAKKAFFKQTPRVISLYTTSAKTGKDVNKIFQRLAITMLNYSKTK